MILQTMEKRQTVAQLAAAIPDGACMTFSGFTIWRRPMALVYELVRQKKRHLHLIEVNGGTHSDILAGAGCVDIWESCFIGHELYGKLGNNMARRIQSGETICEDYSHYQILLRLAAGVAGMPFMATTAAKGTDIMNPAYDMLGRAGLRDGKNPKIPKKKFDYAQDPFYGDTEYILVPAAQPDICVAHVHQIGEMGTVRVEGQRYSDVEAMKAADRLFVIAEEVVPERYLRDEPAANIIPHYMVERYAEVPYGAHPTGCFNRYEIDGDFIRDYYMRTKTQEGFDEWAAEWIYGVPDFEAYLDKIGFSRLQNLTANRAIHYSTTIKRGAKK